MGTNKLSIHKLKPETSSDNKSSTDKLAKNQKSKGGVHWVSQKWAKVTGWTDGAGYVPRPAGLSEASNKLKRKFLKLS